MSAPELNYFDVQAGCEDKPSQRELDAIASGKVVKVCADNQRFWATVTGVSGDTIVAISDIDAMPVLTFEKRHVYDIVTPIRSAGLMFGEGDPDKYWADVHQGDVVGVCLQRTEAAWLEVVEIQGKYLVTKLIKTPRSLKHPALEAGDTIVCERGHILDWMDSADAYAHGVL